MDRFRYPGDAALRVSHLAGRENQGVPWLAVSLVIASCYGAGEIERILCCVKRYLDQQPYHHEVLAVNDGSGDSTGTFLHTFSLRYPELMVWVHNVLSTHHASYSLQIGWC
jgi:hypothetical protein